MKCLNLLFLILIVSLFGCAPTKPQMDTGLSGRLNVEACPIYIKSQVYTPELDIMSSLKPLLEAKGYKLLNSPDGAKYIGKIFLENTDSFESREEMASRRGEEAIGAVASDTGVSGPDSATGRLLTRIGVDAVSGNVGKALGMKSKFYERVSYAFELMETGKKNNSKATQIININISAEGKAKDVETLRLDIAKRAADMLAVNF